jgi:hypothetical protein
MKVGKPLLLVAALLLGPLACAAPCERVQSSHTAFRKATLPVDPQGARPAAGSSVVSDGGAHLSVSVPYELIDAMIAKELGRVPSLALPLPAVSGISLGSLRLGVEAVRARPAAAGELGFRVSVGLREGKRSVLTVDVDARLRPRIDPARGTLAVALSGRDVIALEPSISASSRKQLGEWIWAKLPPAARMLVDRNTIGSLAGELADQLMQQAAGMLRRELLDDLGELARFEFDLPEEVPLRSITLAAGERYLDIDLHTPLRVAHGLPQGRARVEGLHPNLVQVRVSGDAIAALANHAIRSGRIPERWTLEGEPDPEGEVRAGVGWAKGQADPLEVHLWKLESDCAHVVLRGVPRLALVGRGELELGTERARVDSVVGSVKIKAGLFFSKTARRGVALLERTTAATEVEIGTTTMMARIAAAEVRGDEIVLGLQLAPRDASVTTRTRR